VRESGCSLSVRFVEGGNQRGVEEFGISNVTISQFRKVLGEWMQCHGD
jgi:hypothetical protein